MNDLINFLTARLDEHAQIAHPTVQRLIKADMALLAIWKPDHIDELAVDIPGLDACSDSCIAAIGTHTLKLMALAFDRHADYREEWRPDTPSTRVDE